jgi:TonB family protein
MWNKQNIFEPSGCISREAFEAFLRDELAPDVRVTAEEHIASCEFCSDASEGFSSIGLPQASVAMEIVDRSFKKKYLESPKKSSRRITWFSIAAAASVLLLTGLFFMLRDNHPKTQLAENTVPQKEKAFEPEAPDNKLEKPEKKNAPILSENQDNKKRTHAEASKSPKRMLNESPALQPPAPSLEQESSDSPSVNPDEVSKEQEDKKTTNKASDDNNLSSRTAIPSSTSAGKAKRSYSYNNESADKSADEEVTLKKESKDDKAFVVVDENASFQGGDINKFSQYIVERLVIPDSLAHTDISDKVIVQFVIDQKGKMNDIKIIRSMHPVLDKEIVKIVKNGPRWTPAKINNKNVKQQFTLPITFHLQIH